MFLDRWHRGGRAGSVRQQAKVEELRSDLAVVRERYDQLVAEGDLPRRENVLLRYDLQKCQRDRQVLEWHLAATRGELRLAFGLLKRFEANQDAEKGGVAESILVFSLSLRVLGLRSPDVDELEACARQLWRARTGGRRSPEPERLVALQGLSALHRLGVEYAKEAEEKPARAGHELKDRLMELLEKLIADLGGVAGEQSEAPPARRPAP